MLKMAFDAKNKPALADMRHVADRGRTFCRPMHYHVSHKSGFVMVSKDRQTLRKASFIPSLRFQLFLMCVLTPLTPATIKVAIFYTSIIHSASIGREAYSIGTPLLVRSLLVHITVGCHGLWSEKDLLRTDLDLNRSRRGHQR